MGFHHCVLGKSSVVVFVGLLPLSLFASLSCDGETQIWLGDLRLALWLWCFVFGGHDLPIRMRPPVSMLKFSR